MLVLPPVGLWGVLAWRIAAAFPLNRVILWIAFKNEEAARKARWLCHHYLPMRRIAYIHARSMANAESASNGRNWDLIYLKNLRIARG